ncbi:MAG: hypothetical protein K6G44_15255 [Lentisphaeria bacterium]|nr:hypothetical protein [Lentisphaeria bacterium]
MQKGNVFYGLFRELSSGKSHFLIVINTPSEDMPYIVLTAITSQIEKAKRRLQMNGLSPETLVELSPSDYTPLHLPSVVDCNFPLKCPKDLFEMDFGDFNRKEDMPKHLVEKIISGVLLSPLVSNEIKKLIINC